MLRRNTMSKLVKVRKFKEIKCKIKFRKGGLISKIFRKKKRRNFLRDKISILRKRKRNLFKMQIKIKVFSFNLKKIKLLYLNRKIKIKKRKVLFKNNKLKKKLNSQKFFHHRKFFKLIYQTRSN